jgi:iron complex transport system substrate-binding protein
LIQALTLIYFNHNPFSYLPFLFMTTKTYLHFLLRTLTLLFACTLLLVACSGGSKAGDRVQHGGDTLALRHAAYLRMIDYADYTVVELINPWDTTHLLHTYVLVPDSVMLPGDRVKLPRDSASLPAALPASLSCDNASRPAALPAGTVVRTPIRRSLVYSSVHAALLNDLGALSCVAGMCDLKYYSSSAVKEAYLAGRITDCGDSMMPDIERIISLHLDAVLLSPFENSGGYGQIEKLGIPLIECADYMERTPLGRAEWMRFFGRLYGRAAEADTLFMEVESRYEALRQIGRKLVAEQRVLPRVMCDLITGSTWYAPGGQSSIARLYADAGARYLFADDSHTGSLTCSFEQIYERGRDADYWLIRYNKPTGTKTYDELLSESPLYKGFKPFAEKRIYACNTAHSAYYEEVPFHPDRLLLNFISIFHPDVRPGEVDANVMRYYNRMEE